MAAEGGDHSIYGAGDSGKEHASEGDAGSASRAAEVVAGPDGEELSVYGWRGYRSHTFGHTTFVVDARYSNLRPIGRGAYGLVCSAHDALTGRQVAIKRVGKVFTDCVDAKRILREINLLRYLGNHENIVELIDLMTYPPDSPKFRDLYIVTQLYECDLERIVASPQKLTEAHLQYFIYQLLRGLKYIHSASVLHRDLKPPNVLVNAKCDLAICDFGLARGVSYESYAEGQLTEYVVTRWYRAPELLCECKSYGPAVDVWSVGCIMGEVLARRPILQGSSTNQQLQLIIQLLGTPDESALSSIESEAARSVIAGMGYRPRTDLSAVFLGANPLALDLLSKMLEFDHRKRISVQDALEHPYLASLHGRIEDPVCEAPFDFEFERGFPHAMPEELLQELMFTLMEQMHAVVRPEERDGYAPPPSAHGEGSLGDTIKADAKEAAGGARMGSVMSPGGGSQGESSHRESKMAHSAADDAMMGAD